MGLCVREVKRDVRPLYIRFMVFCGKYNVELKCFVVQLQYHNCNYDHAIENVHFTTLSEIRFWCEMSRAKWFQVFVLILLKCQISFIWWRQYRRSRLIWVNLIQRGPNLCSALFHYWFKFIRREQIMKAWREEQCFSEPHQCADNEHRL